MKYGLIRDPDLFTWLERNMERLLARDAGVRSHARMLQAVGGASGACFLACTVPCQASVAEACDTNANTLCYQLQYHPRPGVRKQQHNVMAAAAASGWHH